MGGGSQNITVKLNEMDERRNIMRIKELIKWKAIPYLIGSLFFGWFSQGLSNNTAKITDWTHLIIASIFFMLFLIGTDIYKLIWKKNNS